MEPRHSQPTPICQRYAQRDLAQQIDALLGERDPAKTIPSALRDTVDAIRNFGNFSAHPVTDQTTLQVIDVEPGEDHYYVTPAVAAENGYSKVRCAGTNLPAIT